jgi:hypothetical protein
MSLLVCVLAVPAGAMEVKAEHPAGIDYSRYRTFTWDAQDGRAADHPLSPGQPMGDRVRMAIESELRGLGLVLADAGEADLQVAYLGMLEDYLDIQSKRYKLGGPVVYETMADVPSRAMTPTAYKKGTVIIIFVDSATDRSVWKGWATDVAKSPEKLRAKVEKAIAKILRQYPPS